MQTLRKVGLILPAVLFLVIGLRWLVDPAASATGLGFALGDGMGRSSQIADFGAFFLTLALCVLFGVVTRQRVWFYPPAMLLLLAAIGRLLAWTLHDATLAGGTILFELVMATWILVLSKGIKESS